MTICIDESLDFIWSALDKIRTVLIKKNTVKVLKTILDT